MGLQLWSLIMDFYTPSIHPLFTGSPFLSLDIKIAQAGSPSTSSICICWLTAHQASSPLVHIFLCAAGTCESQQKLCMSGLLLSHSLRSVCSTSPNNTEIIIMPVKQFKSHEYGVGISHESTYQSPISSRGTNGSIKERDMMSVNSQ